MLEVNHRATDRGKLLFILDPSGSSLPIRSNENNVDRMLLDGTDFLHIVLKNDLVDVFYCSYDLYTLGFTNYGKLLLSRVLPHNHFRAILN